MRCFLFIAIAVFAACGGQVMGGVDGGETDGPIGMDVIKPPPPPPPPPPGICGMGSSCTGFFVVNVPYLSDTPRGSMTPSPSAWRAFGEDIDGKVTDTKSTDVCTRTNGAPSSVQNDGNQGIDNSFGANIMPIIQSAGAIPSPSALWTKAIATGTGHTLLFVVNIHGDGSVGVDMLVGAPLGKVPAFDGSDQWPISGLATEGGVSKISFPSASIAADGTLVTGRSKQRGLIVWEMNGASWPMPVDALELRLTLAPGLGSAKNGTLSGVLPTEPLIDSLRQVAGKVSMSLCGSAFDGIAQQLRQTQDILADGTNSMGIACSNISLGMGVEVVPVTLGNVVTESVTKTCP